MRRSTGISGLFSLLRATSASAIVLAIVVSCSESTAPEMRMPDGVTSVQVLVPDSLKTFWLLDGSASLLNTPVDISANLLVPTGAALSVSATPWKYSVSHVPFNVEAIPGIAIPKELWLDPKQPIFDGDGFMQDIPLGFSFNFYGNTYDKVNIYANGFLQFGTPQIDPTRAGFFKGGFIPSAGLPNNIIAFAWTDWSPQLVDGGVRFETRGTAPNRRFLLQFNNVPERSVCNCATGLLMMQLVLDEATMSITIYTNTLRITNNSQRITQGIENETGTAAVFDSIVNPINGVRSARKQNLFSLTNDAVRFSPPRPPVVTAPKDTVVPTAPADPSANRSLGLNPAIGSCFAAFNPGVATATDDISVVSLVGVRSDDASLALDAPYPKGVTSITWTATDNDGMTASATQLVTVVDKELPWLAAPASDSANNDPHLPSAVVAIGSAESADNCPDVTVSSKRSDGAAIDAPFMVGITTITWTATDASGNTTAASQSIKVKDVEAPSLSVPLDFAVKATSPSGATATYQVNASDNVAVTSLSCVRASGAAFPIGINSVNCTASDAAGNSASVSFSVTVIDAPTQMRNLLGYVTALGMPEGTTNPLVNQLSAALGAYPGDQSCKKLNDFVSMVGKKARDIPAGQAEYLIAEATQILNVMGCSSDKRSPAASGKS